MEPFLDKFRELVGQEKQRGNFVNFQKRCGLSKGYLSEILAGKVKTLPSVPRMREALKNADVPTHVAHSILLSLSCDKAEADDDTSLAFKWLTGQIAELEALALHLSAMLRNSRSEMPKNLLKRLDALRKGS